MRAPCDKLVALRQRMRERGLSAYVVPSQDAHQSEYVAEVDKRREWLTGFTGSAGVAVVTAAKALLWTDGRYYEQARREMSEEWQVVRGSDLGAKSVPEVLVAELPDGGRVGVSPHTLSLATARKWDKALCAGKDRACCAAQIESPAAPTPCGACRRLVPVDKDLVDAAWAMRPPRPCNKISIHDAGQPARDKIAELRAAVAEAGADGIVLAALDEIAWLLNLRGSDIAYTPVFFSFLIVTASDLLLFVDPAGLSDPVRAYLRDQVGCTQLHPYDKLDDILSAQLAAVLGKKGEEALDEPSRKRARQETSNGGNKASPGLEEGQDGEEGASAAGGEAAAAAARTIWLDPDSCTLAIRLACAAAFEGRPESLSVLCRPSPVKGAKACKNEHELAGMRRAHVLEGVALCRFFAWLESSVVGGARPSETQVSEKLEDFRSSHSEYRGPSFETISAYGDNASMIHHRPSPDKQLGVDSLYLCDTGGQYSSGTTDMTRTMCFGEPSRFQRIAFSLVLEGHIALARAVFFRGTEAAKLDVLARVPLWQHGLDYRHGTSHGLGAFLGVHEYPPLMHSSLPTAKSFAGKYSPTSMQPNMVLSNEPGFYESGQFGIRIENVMLTKPAAASRLEFAPRFDPDLEWLEFETISLIPIQRKLVCLETLSSPALRWLNEYHATCRATLEPHLQEAQDEAALEWLRRETEPL